MPQFVTFKDYHGEHLALVVKTNVERDPKTGDEYNTYNLFIFEHGAMFNNASALDVTFLDKVEEPVEQKPLFPPF